MRPGFQATVAVFFRSIRKTGRMIFATANQQVVAIVVRLGAYVMVGRNGRIFFGIPGVGRRTLRDQLPKEVAADTGQMHTGTDEVLLKRIRTALRALR